MIRQFLPRDVFARLYLAFACAFALVGAWPLAVGAWGEAVAPCGLAFLFAVGAWAIARGARP